MGIKIKVIGNDSYMMGAYPPLYVGVFKWTIISWLLGLDPTYRSGELDVHQVREILRTSITRINDRRYIALILNHSSFSLSKNLAELTEKYVNVKLNQLMDLLHFASINNCGVCWE